MIFGSGAAFFAGLTDAVLVQGGSYLIDNMVNSGEEMWLIMLQLVIYFYI